ncbi:MAG: ABC transporter permease subunit [Pirellulaceae bacterium]|nr:ABC transporter permease subunit [Pirellulaceae bacterium]
MSESKPAKTIEPAPAARAVAPPSAGWLADWFALRKPVPTWQGFLLGIACLLVCLGIWWFLTRGATSEQRLVGPLTLPSPRETFERLPDLFTQFQIVANTLVTLRRVALGFLLAIAVGVPLGVLAGCYPRLNAFLAPVVMFGRNIPLAAVLPLLLFLSHSGEQRKILFIFIACVAFIISDTARAIMDVAERYVDTAYTLGASRWQTIIKVLVPLAMPTIFGSFRVLFGLAFGYIMLAESIRDPNDLGGLGFAINTFQRRQLRENIYLIILIIPLVALAVDLVLYWMQRQLFPHVYGGPGWLAKATRVCLHLWDDLKRFFFHYEPPKIESAVPPPAAGITPAEPKP